MNQKAPRSSSSERHKLGITVCICTRDRPTDLELTLASLEQQAAAICQVIVSDDGVQEETRNVCDRSAIPVLYTRGPRLGLAANRNHALNAVSSEYVMFMDDDCRLGEEFLDAMTDAMVAAEHLCGRHSAAVTGSELKLGQRVEPSEQSFLGFQNQAYGRQFGLKTVVINSALFPVARAKEVRFDPRLRYGAEEVDFTTRLVASGVAIFHAPDAVNVHTPSRLGRADYEVEATISRLYVTLKRYLFTERRYTRAAAFTIIAPMHTIAAGLRAEGPRGGLKALHILRRSTGYLASYRLERRARAYASESVADEAMTAPDVAKATIRGARSR